MGKGKLLGTLAAMATIAGLGVGIAQLLKDDGSDPPPPSRLTSACWSAQPVATSW